MQIVRKKAKSVFTKNIHIERRQKTRHARALLYHYHRYKLLQQQQLFRRRSLEEILAFFDRNISNIYKVFCRGELFFLFPFWDIPFSLSLSLDRPKRVSFKVTHLW